MSTSLQGVDQPLDPTVTSTLQGVDQPLDPTVRNEVFTDVIKGYLESGKDRQLKLMVIGEAGQGKSTLINGLIGQEVAAEGGSFDAGTLSIKKYHLNQNGVQIEIWDTPGFGMGQDKETIEQLRISNCYPVDLALFCIRLDSTRFPSEVHTRTIENMTKLFSKDFWKNCLFVLTFANNVKELCPPGKEMGKFFSDRCVMIEDKLREALKKYASLEENDLKRVCAVPVGLYKKNQTNPWALPDRDDWFVWFWLDCIDYMRGSAVSALLQANYHRLQENYQEVTPKKIQPCSPSQLDALERFVEADADEISQIKKQIREIQKICPTQVSSSSGSSGTPVPTVATSAPSQLGQDDGKDTHEREIPLIDILLRQLDDKDSSFFEYVKEFATERGKKIKGVGHFVGFFEAFYRYLGKSHRREKM